MWTDPITGAFLKRHGRQEGESPTALRARLGIVEGYVSLVLNGLLAAVKGVIGVVSGSVALTADAVHTLSDCISSGVLVVGAYVTRKPADKEHPFGHGRAEPIAGIVIAVLLGIAAFEFGRASVLRILDPQPVNASWALIALIGLTVLVKLWNSLFAGALARVSDSSAIRADYWHHMSDVLATSLAIVGMVAGRYGFGYVDGIMGLCVSLIILAAAWGIARSTISSLIGEAPSEAELEEIRRLAMGVTGVLNTHDLIVHRYGDLRLVSLHVEVSDRHDTWTAHTIADNVQKRIESQLHGSVTVHVDPINDSHPAYSEVKTLLEAELEGNPEMGSLHDLRLAGNDVRFAVFFDLAIRSPLEAADRTRLRQTLSSALRGRFPQILDVSIRFDPLYAYSIPNEPEARQDGED